MYEPDYSPWGEVQYCTEVSPDIAWEVSTAGHGGVMIDRNAADFLSNYARSIAIDSEGCLCFEEDCDAAVAVYELDQNGLYEFPEYDYSISRDEYMQSVERTLRDWHSDYAASIGL